MKLAMHRQSQQVHNQSAQNSLQLEKLQVVSQHLLQDKMSTCNVLEYLLLLEEKMTQRGARKFCKILPVQE